ncbi:and calcium/calmodulin-dependent serine/threonine-protein kinase [Seminavis robusta]|uniref:And calcium/calmodulin-dependent serine/threonine-protein kinase n=1 Tax=Seminavis robusta TaxID=568900 RepID=A0A9N8HTC7_9STRA|nr:and calcium/calmodulin-dependent serine/threonine-protein kinase [Seminavis robusta]|eukprot:Sro1497_g277590.1 and calcium/calmodulin-dependent serine/threonine-protein kinase (500) ;mRNA; f:9499-11089
MKIPLRIDPIRISLRDQSKGLKINHQTFVFHHEGENALKFQDCYDLGAKLRTFRDVYKCTHKATKTERSVKILGRETIDRETFLGKLAILKKMDHPNLVHVFESFEDGSNYYVVTESMAHDSLYDAISTKREAGVAFGKPHVAQILLTLLECLNYCHSHNVIHGNIQPKNILVPTGMGFDKLLVVNFFDSSVSLEKRRSSGARAGDSSDDDSTDGTSAGMGRTSKRKTRFAAPEAGADGGTHTKSDIWSCGVIGYHLLTGKYPFEKPSDSRKPISRKAWKGMDPEAQEFLRELLAFRPSDRPPASEAYDADWLALAKSVEAKVDSAMQDEVMKSLSKFSKKDKLQQAVSAYIATHLLAKIDKEKWDEIYRHSDRNSDGVISKKELLDGFAKAGIRIPRNEMDELFVRLDMDGNGVIDYSEFLAMQGDLVCQRDKLRAAFDAFDTDGNGYIEKEDLQVIFQSPGEKVISKSTAKAMLKSADQDGDGKLSFEEFVVMMGNH